jgi:hypothetical protein
MRKSGEGDFQVMIGGLGWELVKSPGEWFSDERLYAKAKNFTYKK